MSRVDMTGERYGSLTVESYVGRKNRMTMWACKCDCGKEIEASRANLIHGRYTSCGCAKSDRFRKMVTVHGMRDLPEYSIWCGIKKRCNNKSDKSYKYYGGRGIAICSEWADSFAEFYKHMGDRPSEKHSIDRIDNNGNYEPGNCRWADPITQANNRGR